MNKRQALHAGLRHWAKGLLGREAAVELMIRSFDGLLVSPTSPWIGQTDTGRPCLSFTLLKPGVLPLRHYCVATVAASLSDGAPVDLRLVAKLPRTELELVLAAIAHAGGSQYHHKQVVHPDVTGALDTQLPSLYPWPGNDPAASSLPNPDIGEDLAGWNGIWRARNTEQLAEAVIGARIKVTRRQREALTWLATTEPSIVEAVASIIRAAGR